MAGGLLNIVSVGNNNVFLTGNPSRTFFKVTYSKYSNFGLQKFRLDYDGLRDLRLTDSSTFTFKIPRYAELLMDTYLVLTLPDIWSPIYAPCVETDNRWATYDFRWIEKIGTNMIEEVLITCGSLTLQRYSGAYLAAMVERDFTEEKKKLFYSMSGNVPDLHDPANVYGRANSYPSAYYTNNAAGAEPSIRGRDLYIPINTWFTLNNGCAFPLISLQYNELVISVTLRPIQELFQVRDVFDTQYNQPYVKPDFTQGRFQMYRFLQSPPGVMSDTFRYENKTSVWNADVHLLSTYCFLSQDEAKQFALEDQIYLVKDVFEYNVENVTGTKKISLTSNGMIANWMWFLQRNEVNLRNEWSNYTNWPYITIPQDIIFAPSKQEYDIRDVSFGPGQDPKDFRNTGITITGDYSTNNQRDILLSMGILLNGEYRENTLTRGVYDYVEKYTRTAGYAKEGLYCYNFCLNTSPFETQPSGAMNLSKFKNIELEITTLIPTVDMLNSSFDVICDTSGNPLGIRKTNWTLYDYNFNLTLFEERYNILTFIGGNCGMLYSR
jgi:hypothetical protein